MREAELKKCPHPFFFFLFNVSNCSLALGNPRRGPYQDVHLRLTGKYRLAW